MPVYIFASHIYYLQQYNIVNDWNMVYSILNAPLLDILNYLSNSELSTFLRNGFKTSRLKILKKGG